MSNNQKKSIMPELRFKNDNGVSFPDWEFVELRNIAKRVTKKNKDKKVFRVLTNSAIDGIVDQRDYFDKDIAVKANLDSYYVVEIGDYIYNPRISTVAPVGPISKNKIGVGVMSPLYTVFRFHKKNNDFYEQYFKSSKWHPYLQSVSNSGARHDRMSISNNEFMAMPVPLPHEKEQQKIADCLLALDDIIIFNAQKLDLLKKHKKGLLQQIFPAPGEILPKFRFKEFANSSPWKMQAIGNVLVETQRPISMNDKSEYSLVTVKRRYGGLVSRGIFRGRDIKVKTQFKVRANDFLISKRQIVHCACGIVPKELDGSIVSNEYSVLTPKNGNNISFINYFSQQASVSSSFMQCSIGIVIEKMLFKLKDWIKMEFPFPDLDEQIKIASFLENVDHIIMQQSKKLEMLKRYKKGLMQKLFIITNEVK